MHREMRAAVLAGTAGPLAFVGAVVTTMGPDRDFLLAWCEAAAFGLLRSGRVDSGSHRGIH
jgi:hypothetical protein